MNKKQDVLILLGCLFLFYLLADLPSALRNISFYLANKPANSASFEKAQKEALANTNQGDTLLGCDQLFNAWNQANRKLGRTTNESEEVQLLDTGFIPARLVHVETTFGRRIAIFNLQGCSSNSSHIPEVWVDVSNSQDFSGRVNGEIEEEMDIGYFRVKKGGELWADLTRNRSTPTENVQMGGEGF